MAVPPVGPAAVSVPAATPAPRTPPPGIADPKLREAARGLEEVLLKEMLSAMTRAQLEHGGFFGGGSDGGTRQTSFELLLSQSLAQAEPLGLADRIAGEVAAMQGGAGGGAVEAALVAGAAARQAAVDGAVAGSGQTSAAHGGSAGPGMYRKFTPGTQGCAVPAEKRVGDTAADRRKASPAAEDDR